MAVYGTDPLFAGTSWSFTLAHPINGGAGTPGTLPAGGGATGGVMRNGMGQDDARIANMLNRQANQALRMLFISMIGAAPGATAAKSYKRVLAQTTFDVPGGTNLGGLIPIDTAIYINRANTVTDDNNLTALLNRTHGPAAYAIDVSGNGGGSKAAFGAYR